MHTVNNYEGMFGKESCNANRFFWKESLNAKNSMQMQRFTLLI